MPSIKRWCHLSQEINRDPEFRELVKKFGLGGVRFWLECLAILDRTDNFWDLHRGFDLGLLAASCETKRHIIQGSYEHLRDINWLRVGLDPNQKLFIYAPKWAEYNKKRENKGSMLDTTREDKNLHPFLSFPKEKINKKEKSSGSIKRNHRTTQQIDDSFLKELKQNPAYGDLDIDRELHKCKANMLARSIPGEPSKKRLVNWLNRAYPVPASAHHNGNGHHTMTCENRLELNGRLKPCGQPSTKMIGKRPLCQECYSAFQKAQETINAH